jgi:hypothetical protein
MKNLPNTKELVGYVGGPELHDAAIVQAETLDGNLRVLVVAGDGKKFLVSFVGVKDVTSNKPEGMILYGMVELKGPEGLRRFVFVNWNEEDDAKLEVSAAEYSMEAIF